MFLIVWGLISIVWSSPRAFVLDNGMHVVLEETRHIPQVSMQLHFSFAPERYLEGLPHLVEHLLFEIEKDGLFYDAFSSVLYEKIRKHPQNIRNLSDSSMRRKAALRVFTKNLWVFVLITVVIFILFNDYFKLLNSS